MFQRIICAPIHAHISTLREAVAKNTLNNGYQNQGVSSQSSQGCKVKFADKRVKSATERSKKEWHNC